MKPTITDTQISALRYTVTPCILFFSMLLIHILVIRKKSSSSDLQLWKIHKKITLGVGDYYDVMDRNNTKITRITLKRISQEQMPTSAEFPSDHNPVTIKTDAAILSFDPEFVYCGPCVIKLETSPFLNERHFAMSKIEYQEETYSVFFLRTEYVTDGEQIFRCFVDHINPAKQTVELNIYYLWLKKSNQPVHGDAPKGDA